MLLLLLLMTTTERFLFKDRSHLMNTLSVFRIKHRKVLGERKPNPSTQLTYTQCVSNHPLRKDPDLILLNKAEE